MGKMWWIPCSDWLPGLQTGPSCPLEIARDRSPWSRAGKRSRWMDLQGWQFFHNVGDGVGRKRRTKKTLNNSYGFIVFETSESFLILITSKSFCFLINPLVTKLFRSRWLDITLVFFFFFCVANVQPSWSHACVLHLWINVAVWATAHPLLPSPDLTIVNW